MLNNTNNTNHLTIIFDNAGGALLQTNDYCHEYGDDNTRDAMARMASDVRAFIARPDTRRWDQDWNQPELRRDADDTDQVMTLEEIADLLANGDIARYHYVGYTQKQFLLALEVA